MERWLGNVIQRPVTVGMLTLATVVFGLVSLTKLPIELLPDINYPSLTVQTELPDAAPEEVEQLITRPIEQVVGVVSGLKRYHSISRAGVSEVTLEFAWNSEMGVASLDVREKLDLVQFPDDARSPIVYRFDPSLDPILKVSLGGSLSIRDLRRSPRAQDNMQGPGVTAGAKGDGKAVYFKDPNGHVLEIKTY